MNQPPDKLDGAEVLEWAWSGSKPFGLIKDTLGHFIQDIYGLAICQYSNDDTVYRFACDKNWEVITDRDYLSVTEAKKDLPEQYKMSPVSWVKRNNT